MPVFVLSDKLVFPPPHFATKEGLLAIGGDLSRKRLLLAYRMGIFPWYSKGDPILWWSTDPRLVLYPDEFHTSRSLKKVIRKKNFKITLDKAFSNVIFNCATTHRKTGPGTWIMPEMISAYCDLFDAGYAHSVEAWHDGNLVGGLYGVSIGRCFFGESMFSNISNASKACVAYLTTFCKNYSFDLIDCQVKTDHLISLGAREIPRKDFLIQLQKSLKKRTLVGNWNPLQAFQKKLIVN
jgi:leucyl/phenylalanyl-tRNA--protein transferase